MRPEAVRIVEYEFVARYVARRGTAGIRPLPDGVGGDVVAMIDSDHEAFLRRVREYAYAEACSGRAEACFFCGRDALDGHLTCGRIECSESDARAQNFRPGYSAAHD